MLSEFIAKKLKAARYKLLKDGSYFGGIPGLKGVWANAKNLEDCREELREVLEEWLLLKVRAKERVPGFAMKTDRRELVKHA
ncbi:MAG: antitoxin HicB [Candidatus Terrybacteria bacterium RIFCSPHIGHO2_01_FULL_48_17]|uniref:Antitoxin HicB n=1 Tax=Candidatus Terrybacteria bacterium RIFCSPHIGHO2_01_FULL_48_17 TaxID=1802362 RepID=A0A1G2PJD3_9BACT|nr:MAG: antitoxin HicB [Candidatus Terrybacteria bacterium RIFCSPHIGHO2_01_FULL_48_17]OHA53035.1 MAG: antitoxin HicB [Candidatus Terrybacteria bacterium RIFCSPLOWO2_01_FULL_48_14]